MNDAEGMNVEAKRGLNMRTRGVLMIVMTVAGLASGFKIVRHFEGNDSVLFLSLIKTGVVLLISIQSYLRSVRAARAQNFSRARSLSSLLVIANAISILGDTVVMAVVYSRL
jgi:hypothetical protein